MAALAGVLVLVAWNMTEKPAFSMLPRDWRTGAVLLATFGLTVARDLTTGILAGCLLAAAFLGAQDLAPTPGGFTRERLQLKRRQRGSRLPAN